MGVTIRPGRAGDVVEFYGSQFPATLRLWTAEADDGEIIGLAGYYLQRDYIVVFSDMHERMERYPVLIMKTARRIMEHIDKTGLPAVCFCKGGRSGVFLRRLGWTQLVVDGEMEAYRWQN